MTRVPRVLLPWTLAMIGAGAGVLSTAHAAGAPAAPAAAPAQPRPLGPPDLRALEEMEKDVQHFATMVTEYRPRRARS